MITGILRTAVFDARRLAGLRSFWVLCVLGLAIHVLISAATVGMLVAMRGSSGLEYGPSDIATLVLAREPALLLVGGLVAIVVVGQEYRHSSRTAMALLSGSVPSFVVAKLVVVLAAAGLLAVVGVLASAALLLLSGLTPTLSLTALLAVAGGRAAAVVVAAGYAACLVMVVRSQTMGLAALLAVPLVVENGVALAVRQLGDGWWQAVPARLPYTSLDSFVQVGVDAGQPSMFAAPALTPVVALLFAVAYLGLGFVSSLRRA